MKKFFIIPALIFSAGVAAWFIFKEPVFKATNGYLVNLDNKGVIIDGYDPISYFTGNGPVKGKPEFTANYQGAVYWFENAAHAEEFKLSPEKYAPQYGGFCGYGVSIGKLRPVDPTIYQIEDGRLILQHTQEAFKLFNKDLEANTKKADQNWPGLVAKHVDKPVEYDQPASAKR